MNINHANLCPSPEWAAHIQNEVLPFLTRDVDLGSEMIELGPGPGRRPSGCVARSSSSPQSRWRRLPRPCWLSGYADANVTVVVGSAAELEFADESFDSAGCFTMLHHVPTLAMQNKIFAEAFRVLRPGGVLIGSDSLASNDLHHFHADDTYNPIEPSSVLSRLQTVGFGSITIVVDGILKFIAHKPTGAEHECGRNTSADDSGQAEASTQ